MPKHPYVASPGPLLKAVEALRRSFPKEVTASTLRKLGVAPNNESYVINVLRFLGIIDEEGKKVDDKAVAFLQHKDESFQSEFEEVVKEAYSEVFGLLGERAWVAPKPDLVQFFRANDHSTDIVGSRQATTFVTLAALAGHGEAPAIREPAIRAPSQKPAKSAAKPAPKAPSVKQPAPEAQNRNAAFASDPANPRVGLTVRIEVNLPADGDQRTYDAIFQSIRKHLIDGEAS